MAVVEAQRLIALSLGKISQSRIQRGGINLHKNLLVASVLYKARTAFIMENSRSRSDSESSEDECPGWESDNTSETSTSGNDYQSKKEMGSSSPSSPEPVESDDCFESEDKENSPPSENHSESDQDTDENAENMATDKQTNCQRCQKRRIADVDSEEYTAHDSAGDSVASSKKPRLELSESQKDNKYNSCEAEQSSPPEAMQISTLVNSFNSGFTGLLNTDSTDSLSCSPKDVYESSGVQGQGHTATDSLISCSTQIKEAFETLARPILALTV